MSNSTPLHNPPHAPHQANLPPATYNPIADHRRCAICGQSDGWRCWVWDSNPGGWYCYSPIEAIRRPGEIAHIWSALSGLGGVA